MRIHGTNFIPDMKLAFVASPTFRGAKGVELATARADSRGNVSLVISTNKLLPGEYILRAWSATALAAQMAEIFLEVSV